MIIGVDFEKISVNWGGFIVLEPNVFLTDALLSFTCIYLAIKIWKGHSKNPFVNWYMAFFFMLGVSTFTGGLGHAFYHYWGTPGKFFGWFTAVLAIFFIERAMISFVYNQKLKKVYKSFSWLKMFAVYALVTWLCLTKNVMEKPEIAFLPIAINTILGTILSAGILGLVFYRKHAAPFHFFAIGVLTMLPAAVFFLWKINIHPWMDKNDVSHILASIGNIFFYIGIVRVTPELHEKFNTQYEA